MAYAQPIIGAVTLPHVAKFDEQRDYRGAMAEMANGSVHFDNVTSTPKRTFTLSWNLIDASALATIYSAFALLATSSATFTIPDGTGTCSVTRTKAPLKFSMVNGTGGLLWSGSMELREV